MRNTKDIADSVFKIRDEYLEQKRVKNKKIKRACAAVSVFSMAGIITAGTVHFISHNPHPDREPDQIPVVEEIPDIIVTTAGKSQVTSATASSVNVSETTAIVTTSIKNGGINTSSVRNDISPSGTTSSAAGEKTSVGTTVTSVFIQTSVQANTDNKQTTTVSINDDIDYEEVIRMKVEYVKKYFAALSAAAISSSMIPGTVNAESVYTPKAYAPGYEYIKTICEEPGLVDYSGNDKFDAYDLYALYAYIHEQSSVPEDIAKKCSENGDINKDGNIDNSDFDILYSTYFAGYDRESMYNYTEGEATGKIITEGIEESNDEQRATHYKRHMSPDCTPEETEKYFNEYVDESYTYGSESIKNSFLDLLFETSFFAAPDTFGPYIDYRYISFSEAVENSGLSYDINADGKEDMKDLYDFYLYDILMCNEYEYAEARNFLNYGPEKIEIINGFKFISYANEVPIGEMLTISAEDKELLRSNCKAWYDLAENYIVLSDYNFNSPLDVIARYIMSRNELDEINTRTPYYINYRGDLEIYEHSVAEEFIYHLSAWLYTYFDNNRTSASPSGTEEYDAKFGSGIFDSAILSDNELYISTFKNYQDEIKKGNKEVIEMLDVNGDGKIDGYDVESVALYSQDLYHGIAPEFSIVPQEQWDHIRNAFDADKDGVSGTFVDKYILEGVVGDFLSEYERDVYYLRLAEMKGIVDLSDIRPLLERVCKEKETGDVNLDGTITAVDASEVLTYYSEVSVEAEVNNVTEAKMHYMADFNSDGVVDNRDASAILTVYAENSIK